MLSISKENDAVKEEVINLKKENERLSSDLEELCQYGRRLCLRIDNIPVLERESSEEVLRSVKSLIEKSGEVIPDSTLDRAHRIGPVYTNKEKGKCQSIIVRFSTFRHRTLFYRARRKIKTGEKIRLDLTKHRYQLLKEAVRRVEGEELVSYCYADVNCRLKIKWKDDSEDFFNVLGDLNDLLDRNC